MKKKSIKLSESVLVHPLLRDDDSDSNDEIKLNKYKLLPKASVIGIVSLFCIFCFILLTILFGIFFYKLVKNDLVNFSWPKPSKSLLGEYSTAAVAADNVFCSSIGRDILLQDGNAVDAAIAALFCIGVMDTQSAGLGGGHFMTIYNATTQRCTVVDAREIAPLAATENMYKDQWNNSKFGWKSIAVPGELHGLWTEYLNFGSKKVSWKSLIQPTILLMQNGYPTSHALASALKKFEKQILQEPTMRFHFINLETNKVYNIGEQITTRKNLINTLKVLAYSDNPIKEFYDGSLTKLIIDEFKKNGGLLTLDDFKQYSSKIREGDNIICTKLNEYDICGPPPPSGSAVAQAILNIMNKSKITDYTHPDAYYGKQFFAASEDHGTTHISVIDKYGNAVSVTSTINLILGALVMSESTGILWNDEMDDFSTPGHSNYFGYPPSPSNYIKPKKRPMSSMSPLIIFNKKTREVAAIGGAGGSTIISGVAGAALHNILGYNIKEAIDFPRFHNQLKPNFTYYETKWPKKYIDALKKRGHLFYLIDSLTVITGVHKYSNKTVYANSDYRKGTESEPAGY